MKRASGHSTNGTVAVTTAKATKKKAKWAVEKAKEGAEVAVEEQKEAAGGGVAVMATEMVDLEEWGGLWSGVDEEMSWATCWCPFWEMEAAEGYEALYVDGVSQRATSGNTACA